MRAIPRVHHVPLARRPESLNRKVLPLIHPRLEVGHRNNRHALITVNAIMLNVVSVEVLHTLHLVRLAVVVVFVGFHDFLD